MFYKSISMLVELLRFQSFRNVNKIVGEILISKSQVVNNGSSIENHSAKDEEETVDVFQ